MVVATSTAALSGAGLKTSTSAADKPSTFATNVAIGVANNRIPPVTRNGKLFDIDFLSQSACQNDSFDAGSSRREGSPHAGENSRMQTRPVFATSPRFLPFMNNDWGIGFHSSTPSHQAFPLGQSFQQSSSFLSPVAQGGSPVSATYSGNMSKATRLFNNNGGPTYQPQGISTELEPQLSSPSCHGSMPGAGPNTWFSEQTPVLDGELLNQSADRYIQQVGNGFQCCSGNNPNCHCCQKIAALENRLNAIEQILKSSDATTRSQGQVEKKEPDFTNEGIIRLKGAAFIKGLGFTNAELDNLLDDCQCYWPHRTIDIDFAMNVMTTHNCREAEELAKWLVLESFSLNELNGRNCGGRAGKQALDKDRMREIKHVVLQAFPKNDNRNDKLWTNCTDRINRSLRYLTTKFRHNPWIKVGLSW